MIDNLLESLRDWRQFTHVVQRKIAQNWTVFVKSVWTFVKDVDIGPKKNTFLVKFVDKNKNVKFMANWHVSWWTYVHEIVRQNFLVKYVANCPRD